MGMDTLLPKGYYLKRKEEGRLGVLGAGVIKWQATGGGGTGLVSQAAKAWKKEEEDAAEVSITKPSFSSSIPSRK